MKKTFTRSPFSTLGRAAATAVLPLALATFGCTPAPQSSGDDDGAGGSSRSGSGGKTGSGGSQTGSGGSNAQGRGGSEATGSGGSTGAGGSSGGSTGSGGNSAGGNGGGSEKGGASGTGGSMASDGGADVPVTPPAAGAGCTGVTAKFCDDWEKQEAGKAPTGDFTAPGTGVVVDGTKAFSGTKSLHYTTGSAKKVMLTFTKQLPIADLHGRLMIMMPKKPVTQNHWDIIQSKSGNYHWELGGMYGKFELVVDPPDDGIDSPTVFPEGPAWHCIQWNFKSGANVFSAKLNGELVKPSPVMNRWKTSGPFTNVTIGYEIFGSGAAEFWIDDLAFGEQEIPCPAK